MEKGKKYNTFSGVFTPSLLTILGVIMYMRLGWVVGEAGLVGTLIIIAIAHIISVSTGLSISSIATDKKIKTGGIYYILSRSLGLPMGGAIGIALFIGTALSISLYIVGFSESFLSLDTIQQFTGLTPDINGTRIVGTAVIVLLVVVAFISTSLAMKMQFFILIAIGISIISIALGLFENASTEPITLPMKANEAFPLEYVFAIFFPAVTGFTAGVAMSGDLNNPKKAIPRGTILAIAVGFVVYVLLSIAIAIFIPREKLLTDYNILVNTAWSSALVIAGIWGATLSSALGGILGGPRILQAISKDKMSPKIFAKGHGESNEPRNALLLIFFIAECGILIGELDIIAGVVSMFYLASYGFINLSYVLEKWANSDFRPTFSIHISFGIIGFIASFAVMFKLDMISMLASLLIMGLLYFILKRREIRSESGDVWQSVWTSIARRSLAKLENKKVEEHNWNPNIILFSGNSNKRPHLISFGKSIIGKYGLMSNFDLIENPNSKILFSKKQQAIKVKDKKGGIFIRQQSVKNIYDGIEMIAQTYGFSGVEPNTILMGWGRQTKDPNRFIKMLETLSALDYNVLMIDYDKTNGFGNKKQIDIWWEDTGKHGNLSLTLAKFLRSSDEWNHANVRIMIVNSENSKIDLIRNKAESFLENIRIDADLKIINNEIEKKSLYDIMKVESQNTDLIFLSIPEIDNQNAEQFVQKTNALMNKIGSIVLVKTSSVFKNLHLGLNEIPKETELPKIDISKPASFKIKDIKYPPNQFVSNILKKYSKELQNSYKECLIPSYQNLAKSYLEQIEEIEQHFAKTIVNIQKRLRKASNRDQVVLIQNQKIFFLQKLNKQIEIYLSQHLPDIGILFEKHHSNLIERQNKAFEELPFIIKITYDKLQMEIDKLDNPAQRRYKWWRQHFPIDKFNYRLKFKKIVQEQYFDNTNDLWIKHFEQFGLQHIQYALELLKLAKTVDKQFGILRDLAFKNELNKVHIETEILPICNVFENLKILNTDILNKLSQILETGHSIEINKLSAVLSRVHPNGILEELPTNNKKKRKHSRKLELVPSAWLENQNLIYNAVATEIRLLCLNTRIRRVIENLSNDYSTLINSYLSPIESILNNPNQQEINFEDIDISEVNFKIKNLVNNANTQLNRSLNNFPDKIKIYQEEVFNQFEKMQYERIPSLSLSIRQSAYFLIKDKLEAPLMNASNKNLQHLSTSLNRINDNKRLISFVQDNDNEENTSVKNNNIEELKTMISEIKKNKDSLILEFKSLINEMSQQLSYPRFIKTVSHLRQYIIKQHRSGNWENVRQKAMQIFQTIKQWKVDIIYAKSQALTLKSSYQDHKKIINPVDKLLDFTEQLTPSKYTIDKLPFFYKQLFTSQEVLHKDFWIGRAEEIKNAKKAIERYHMGYKGAIAIIAENGLGKSFFAEQLAYIEQPKNRIKINLNDESSNNLESLQKIFNQATGYQNKSIEYILNRSCKNTWVTIEDLENWWNIEEPKQEVIDYLFKLIAKYSQHFLFIIVSNKSVFSDISKIPNYIEYFISVIELSTVDAKTLSQIIMNRHNASGYKLRLNGKLYKDRNEALIANFFNKIHKLTDGNIEAALQMWINSIADIKNDTLYMQVKDLSNLNLKVLDMDSCVILRLLLKYKNIKLKVLTNALDEEEETLKNKMNFLIRSGLVESRNHQYYLNQYCRFHIWNFLHHKELI